MGDIVRYRNGSMAVMQHRIIETEDGADGPVFVTQGDNNTAADDPVVAEQIEEEVVLVIPEVGWVAIGVKDLISHLP